MLVPQKEMPSVVSVEGKAINVRKDSWVRMKIGICKGDLGKVRAYAVLVAYACSNHCCKKNFLTLIYLSSSFQVVDVDNVSSSSPGLICKLLLRNW